MGSKCISLPLQGSPYRCVGVRSPGPASSLSLPEGATSLPPGLITCAPTHHSQLFPMCGLFMHLSPVPLPAEITFTSTHMCMFVFHCVYYVTDYIRFCALGTPALRCRLGCPVLDYCSVFACWLLI